MPTALDNGQRSPHKLLAAVVAAACRQCRTELGATVGQYTDRAYLHVASSWTSSTVTVPFAFAVMWARKCS
jgi:hypothetical protein